MSDTVCATKCDTKCDTACDTVPYRYEHMYKVIASYDVEEFETCVKLFSDAEIAHHLMPLIVLHNLIHLHEMVRHVSVVPEVYEMIVRYDRVEMFEHSTIQVQQGEVKRQMLFVARWCFRYNAPNCFAATLRNDSLQHHVATSATLFNRWLFQFSAHKLFEPLIKKGMFLEERIADNLLLVRQYNSDFMERLTPYRFYMDSTEVFVAMMAHENYWFARYYNAHLYSLCHNNHRLFHLCTLHQTALSHMEPLCTCAHRWIPPSILILVEQNRCEMDILLAHFPHERSDSHLQR